MGEPRQRLVLQSMTKEACRCYNRDNVRALPTIFNDNAAAAAAAAAAATAAAADGAAGAAGAAVCGLGLPDRVLPDQRTGRPDVKAGFWTPNCWAKRRGQFHPMRLCSFSGDYNAGQFYLGKAAIRKVAGFLFGEGTAGVRSTNETPSSPLSLGFFCERRRAIRHEIAARRHKIEMEMD